MKLKTRMKALKIVSFCSIGFGIFFGVLTVLFYFGNWNRVIISSLMGAFLGLLVAPELEPDVFKNPRFFQTVTGFMAGILFGSFLKFPVLNIFLAGIICGFLGLFSSYWLKHFPGP